MKMEKQTSSQWWRWILMPLAAYIFAPIVAIFIAYSLAIVAKANGMSGGFIFLYVIPVIATGALGYTFAKISCDVAPSRKFAAGAVMVAFLSLICIASAAWAWISQSIDSTAAIQSTIGAFATVIPAILRVAKEREKHIYGDGPW